MEILPNIYLGTWQFEKTTVKDAQDIVETAKSMGIRGFDTAYVYAHGEAERILGDTLDENDTVVTKIPAKNKNDPDFDSSYPIDFVKDCLAASIQRLQRTPNAVLLHNWQSEWESQQINLQTITNLLGDYKVPQLGISLPNGYDGTIEKSEYLDYIDIIELPFNVKSPLITLPRIKKLAQKKTVLVRSLFMHGEDATNIPQRIEEIISIGAHPVVGASRTSQLADWGQVL